ncbi:MAG TPA: DUF1595 domain-containing protein, partial [Polyangiaceae bacterium]|nr:DUF1595 domain-containing protein [Polyangiaceae bacterium]
MTAFDRAIPLLLLACLDATGCAAATAPPSAPVAALLPARLRRLSNVEYERTANSLTRLNESFRDELPPDERQDGYTVNERQTVTSYYAAALERLAERLAGLAVTRNLDALLPCPASMPPSSRCVGEALDALGETAFRRPLTAEERNGVRSLYERGASLPATGDAPRDPRARGVALVLSTVLRSPSLLYLSELGDARLVESADEHAGDKATVATLNSYEVASALSYTVTGAPPDAELFAAAAVPNLLLRPDVREAEARRLLSRSSTR